MNTKKHITKNLISLVFLLLIGGVIVNSTFFLHAHKNNSGKIVFHAHPFDKGTEKQDPLSKHNHSKLDLDYYSSLDYFSLEIETIDFEFRTSFELELLSKPCTYISSYFYLGNTNRGPPQTISIV